MMKSAIFAKYHENNLLTTTWCEINVIHNDEFSYVQKSYNMNVKILSIPSSYFIQHSKQK